MMQRSNASMMMGASSWRDQFLEAFTVQAGTYVQKNFVLTYWRVLQYFLSLCALHLLHILYVILLSSTHFFSIPIYLYVYW